MKKQLLVTAMLAVVMMGSGREVEGAPNIFRRAWHAINPSAKRTYLAQKTIKNQAKLEHHQTVLSHVNQILKGGSQQGRLAEKHAATAQEQAALHKQLLTAAKGAKNPQEAARLKNEALAAQVKAKLAHQAAQQFQHKSLQEIVSSTGKSLEKFTGRRLDQLNKHELTDHTTMSEIGQRKYGQDLQHLHTFVEAHPYKPDQADTFKKTLDQQQQSIKAQNVALAHSIDHFASIKSNVAFDSIRKDHPQAPEPIAVKSKAMDSFHGQAVAPLEESHILTTGQDKPIPHNDLLRKYQNEIREQAGGTEVIHRYTNARHADRNAR